MAAVTIAREIHSATEAKLLLVAGRVSCWHLLSGGSILQRRVTVPCHVDAEGHPLRSTKRRVRTRTLECKFGMGSTINPLNIVRDVVVIGASAGGHSAVVEILSRLPKDLPAFIGVVIHRGAVSKSDWSRSLGSKTALRVVEPVTGDPLSRGVVYVAPSDCHMTFHRDRVWLDRNAKEHFTRPAVDPLFVSAARAYGPRVVAIVLTGGGHDGMQGLLHVTTAGGLCLVQKPSEAEHTSMPEYAIAHDHVRAALTVDEIGDALVLLARGRAVAIDAADQILRSDKLAAQNLAG
jgi:two-component system, chemotaxis family, protein-glutamate methylesterase/glutaminase